MKRIISLVVMLGLCSNVGFAAFSKSDLGTSSVPFLKLGAGARPVAMGDAFAGVADDSTAIYWNPAGLNQIKDKGSLTFMHAIWFEDISYDWVSYARPYKDLGVIGIGIQYLSYGNLIGRDSSGIKTGDFTPTDTAVSFSYARRISGICVGANLKYISSEITNIATAFALDLGAMKRFMDNKLTVGAVLQNVGTKLKYVSDEESLPTNIKIGGAYSIKDNWMAVMDINAPVDGDITYGLGTEYIKTLKNKMVIAGRAGYNTRNTETGGLNGFTVGFGLNYLDYSFDYAFVPYGDLGDTNRISFSVKFK